jgi:DNA-binding response OmpR family regulator
MPEMNGIEVLRQIRTIDASAMVMILTGWGSDDLEQQARQLGVTAFLSKTLALDTVVASMERFLPPTTQVEESPLQPPAHTESPSPSVEKPKEKSAPAKVLETDRILLIGSNTYAGGIIMLSGTEDETLVNLAIDMGSVDILGKPLDPERLMVALQVGMLLRTKEASKMAEIRLKCPNGHEGQMTPMQTQPNEGASSPQPGWMCKVCGAIVMRCLCGWPLYRDPSTLIFEDCRNPDCLLANKTRPPARKKKRSAPRRPPRR